MPKNKALLTVEELQATINMPQGEINPVNNISFSIKQGEILALVGESGSGKSLSALSIMGLNSNEIKYAPQSQINFKGENLLKASASKMRKIRGNEISMIFQDPMFSLNPVHQIGKQITETILLHEKVSYKLAKERAVDLLTKTGISDAERIFKYYPHQLSGGMRQRVMIAIALSSTPQVLIADEPTTALDVTIQAQVLNVLIEIQKELNLSILLITHDLGVVSETANRVIVMYCGKIVEEGSVSELFKSPKHPYTQGLLDSIPPLYEESQDTLDVIPGNVPDPLDLPEGCNFVTRCEFATEKCLKFAPPLKSKSATRRVACWNPLNEELRGEG